MNRELIAPCGMNCRLCSGYLAYSKGIPKKRGKIIHCAGCRPRNKQCAYLMRNCSALREKKIDFCFECADFPCNRLMHTDERYKKNFNASLIENLYEIKSAGLDQFIKDQKEKYKCPKCGDVICIHNGKCYKCDKIESWKG
jgi:hypothetical protein